MLLGQGIAIALEVATSPHLFSMSDIVIRSVSSLEGVDSRAWDQLEHGDSPFMRYGFLRALELSDSVGAETGWLPAYLLVEQDEQLLGACAAYVKTDSYGEYIFDWAWARAASRFGVSYYPKLVVAAPFTPATGKRLLVAKGQSPDKVYKALANGILGLCDKYQLSSAHLLFCSDSEAAAMESLGFARRKSLQYHWHNRDYANFDAFLAALKSRKRKQIRKERAGAQAAFDSLDFVPGRDWQEEDLEALNRYYRKTVAEHGGFDYLRPGFFREVMQNMPDTVHFSRARKDGRTIAGALFFETENALYGRYWGCDEQCEFLHFEVAYYAAIERCIDRGISLFEAGAQGQHKLVRGFDPALTHSVHMIAERDFDNAIRGFVAGEAQEITGHLEALSAAGPYRCD